MIDEVRKAVLAILQKNNRGWITPERFNAYAHLAQLETFEGYFFDYDRATKVKNRRQLGGRDDYNNIADHLRQKIDPFVRWDTATVGEIQEGEGVIMPSDFYRLLGVYGKTGSSKYGTMPFEIDKDLVEMERVDFRRFALLTKSNIVAPDMTFPIYTMKVDFGGSPNKDNIPSIYVYPQDISGVTGFNSVFLHYVRTPRSPKWTYNTVAGNPVFNASDSDYQDFEVHPGEEYQLVYKILSYAGLTIREQDVVNYAEMQEQQDKQTENRQ